MNTKSALEKLTDKQRRTIDTYKKNYSDARDNMESHDELRREQITQFRSAIAGYLTALEDIGTLTQAQARMIYTYATL